MKKFFLLILVIILVTFSACKEAIEVSNYHDEILGAYRYTGNYNGMAILSDKHFLFVPNMKTDTTLTDSLTTAKKIRNLAFVESGTWTMQDSIITYTFQFHSNPSKIGTSVRVKHIANSENDTVVGQILGENDEVIYSAKLIKLD